MRPGTPSRLRRTPRRQPGSAPRRFDWGNVQRLPGRYGKTKHFLDVHKELTGKDPSGPAWEAYKWVSTYLIWPFLMYTPPDVPDEAVAALREGFVVTAKDAAFRTDYAKSVGPIPNFVNGREAGWLLSDYKNASPAALQGLKKLTARPGGAKKRKKRKK